MFNKCIIMGRLCADPEFRQTTSGIPVCKIRIAVNRPKKQDGSQDADFIGCTAWRQTAEFISNYFAKGQMILVEGQLRNNDYTDQNNVKHYSYDVQIENVRFCGGKNEDGHGTQHQEPQPQRSRQTAQSAPVAAAPKQETLSVEELGDFEEILSDGEVPF